MNRHEKIAWYNLAVFAFSLMVFVTALAIARQFLPYPIALKSSFGAFGICGLMGLGPALFKRRQESGILDERKGAERFMFDSEMDERDILIQRKARLHGFGMAWVAAVLLAQGFWLWVRFFGPSGTTLGPKTISIDVDMLPLAILGGFIITIVADSISTVLQYRNERIGDNSVESGMALPKRSVVFVVLFIAVYMAVNVFITREADTTFAAAFLMFNLAIVHLVLRTIGINFGRGLTPGNILLLKVSERTTGLLFVVLFAVSTALLVKGFMGTGSKAFILGLLPFEVFGALILVLTVGRDIRNYMRKRAHE